MTAPFIAEAERAAAEAVQAHRSDITGPDARCSCGVSFARFAEHREHQATLAVAAVVPFLAEHFAQAVEALPYEVFDTETPEWVDREDVLRVIREAANPTEGDQAPDDECASCGEGIPEQECPKSKRPCGHHCNHTWTHDSCDWCGFTYEGDQA